MVTGQSAAGHLLGTALADVSRSRERGGDALAHDNSRLAESHDAGRALTRSVVPGTPTEDGQSDGDPPNDDQMFWRRGAARGDPCRGPISVSTKRPTLYCPLLSMGDV